MPTQLPKVRVRLSNFVSWNPGIERKTKVKVRLTSCPGIMERKKQRSGSSCQTSWNPGIERKTKVRVRLSNFVSWNPGIEGGKGSGSGCRTRVLESWNRRRKKRVRVRLSNFVSSKSWKRRKQRSGSGGCLTSCL